MLIDYDKYSIRIDNKRILIKSASIHYFRLPGQNLWRDRLNKLKAAGYNTVDIYFCWGYHSKEPGKYDFTGLRDVRALLDIAAELGLFVIARPGPYINAEVSLGGLPKWLLNQPNIILRNRKDGNFVYSEVFMKYLHEWYSRIIPIINEYHNIIAFQIENEYFTNEAEPDYMQELYDLARSMGIKVPIFHNDILGVGLYSDIVNIYAFDNYPSINMSFDWRNFPDTFGVLDNAEENIAGCLETSPLFVAELQAGWYDKWLGFGYDHIRKLFGREHINIATKTALSQGITMFNHYMGCGGTSWDQIPSSEVYTSYDFAAPVSEIGIPQENYYKAKEINYFLKAFNLSSTVLITKGCDVTGSESENIFTVLRNDNINNCKWLFIRNLNKQKAQFSLSDGNNVSVKPFDMKILPVNLKLKACNIDFSGMSIFARVEHENAEILLMLLEADNELKLSGFNNIKSSFAIEKTGNQAIIKSENLENLTSCELTNNNKTTKIIFLDEITADKTWIIEDKILIGAEFLTDNSEKAAFSSETEVKILSIKEDMEFKTKQIPSPIEVKLPEMEKWLCYNASPEIDPAYDCSSWNFLNDGKFDCVTNRIYDDYIWYKGIFKGYLNEIEINAKHCYAIYLNGKQIFYYDCLVYEEGSEIPENITFNIDKRFLNEKGPNELTILVQNLGFDRGFQNELIIPRGVLSLKTFPQKEIKWQIRGGLTPVIEEWTESVSENLESASDNSYIKMIKSGFEFEYSNNIYNPLLLDMSECPFEKADIFLNGNMIGRHWKNKSPQKLFYLPEDLLENKNMVSLVIWDVKPENFLEQGCENPKSCVKIKIRNIKLFELGLVRELL
ncbi:MAG TPA: beta-galactosidase [Candidatus Gastranaerophilales bacterium]|nr:beta-galactosidase [Candidatus Gastranaerophilales bacterium]